jgi:hypothetical protein
MPAFARVVPLAVVALAAALAGCGGGGGGGGSSAPPPVTATPTPTPSPTPFPGATATLEDIPTQQTLAAYAGNSGTIALAPSSGSASITLAELTSLIPPVAVPTFPPDASTGNTPAALLYVTLTASTAVGFVDQPTLSLQLASAPPANDILYTAFYDSANPANGWIVSGVSRQSPGSSQVTLFGGPGSVTLTPNAPYVGAVLEVASAATPAAHARRR